MKLNDHLMPYLKQRTCFLLWCLASAGGSIFSQMPSHAQESRIAPGPQAVSVLSGKTGKPIESVYVRIGGRLAATDPAGKVIFDGLPAGEQTLVIEHFGYDRLAQPLQLQAGKRSDLTLKLNPVEMVLVKGKVSVGGHGGALAGARIALLPVTVLAACQGRYDFTTTWDGTFQVIQMPPGQYRAQVSAVGCLPQTFDLQVKSGMPPIDWSLSRTADPAQLTVTVKDSVSGAPIAGAAIRLAEAGESGVIMNATAGESGTAVIKRLKTGTLNWMDASGALGISRRAVTVMATAVGYEPGIINTELSPAAAAVVSLNPLTKMVSDGSNSTLQRPMPIRTGAPVEFKIEKVGDKRFFLFRLDYPSQIKITVGPKNPIETLVQLFNAKAESMRVTTAVIGADNILESGGLPIGTYVVEVEEWFNDRSSVEPLTLLVTKTPAPDVFEPNNTIATARLIRAGEAVRNCILPVHDVDWFRFDVNRPSHVRVTMPKHPTERLIGVRDANGKGLNTGTCTAGATMDFVTVLNRGGYFLDLHEWFDDSEYVVPSTMRLEQIADDGIDDPAFTGGRPAAVRELKLGALVGNTIFPTGDTDTYAISIPSAGRFQLQAISDTEVQAVVFSPTGTVLANTTATTKQLARASCDLDGPTTLYVRVHEWFDDNCSPWPYVLSTWFEPCDELELAGRNDLAKNAVPIELNEPARGSIMPARDVDWYRFEVDFPGWLEVSARGTSELQAILYNPKVQPIGNAEVVAGAPLFFERPVFPGTHFVAMHEWFDDNSIPPPYQFMAHLRRAEPQERLPLASDPIRILKPGEGQSFWIDQVGDVDRFFFSMVRPGKFTLRIRNASETLVNIVDDQTGASAFSGGFGSEADIRIDLEAKTPTRYRIELHEWFDDQFSREPGFILADLEGRTIPGAWVESAADAFDPTKVTFTRKQLKYVSAGSRMELDADGDGKVDADLSGGSANFRYAAEGIHRALAYVWSPDGVKTMIPFWVEATGPRERKGIHVVADYPSEGQVVDRDLPVRARAISYSGVPVTSISLAVDGRLVKTVRSEPYEFELPWAKLGAGPHKLSFVAVDAKGASRTLDRQCSVSEFFDLQPVDGSVVSGNAVRVTWEGEFGPSRVRYRPVAIGGAVAADWKEKAGDNGATHVVVLDDLEPGKAYEFQPVGTDEKLPPRTVTRVKGLAFGKSRYGAAINRDYDQRLGISVRNHADKALMVKLECGKPAAESLLLVGFVGDGSEGAPFSLAPGEEREFLLGISAQDVVKATHQFPIRIASLAGDGFADEVIVELNVKLPKVDLQWEEKGEIPGGVGKLLLLKNKGDTLTDLSLASSSRDLVISPSLDHGLFQAGSTIEVRAMPRLYEGFRSVDSGIVVKSVDKVLNAPQQIALKEGESIYGVDLRPKSASADSEASDREAALAASYMNPDSVDWSRKTNPQDTDGDGRIDRWSVDIPAESTRWIGNDTDGDGVVDFVQADIGMEGRVEYSAMRGKQGWEETNLVDSHLEMGFKLPWSRGAYEKHDVDVVVNDTVVGKLRDTIPEGNYTFRVPPTAYRFGENGAPENNIVSLHSKHLRGGHYVVSSDFRMKMDLTGTRVLTAAKSQVEADKAVRATPGLVLDAPDLSISSEEMRVVGEPVGGAPLKVSVPLRNLGAGAARQVEIALRFNAGGEDIELTRTAVASVPPASAPIVVEIASSAPAGDVVLKVVVDPDKKLADCDLDNNEARAPFKAAGDAIKPTLDVTSPEPNAELKSAIVPILAKAEDDKAVNRVDVKVDGGIWAPLSRSAAGYSGKALMQPGVHQLVVRAMDTSGNTVEKSVSVSVKVPVPMLEITDPPEGTNLDMRELRVFAKCGPGTAQVAARANGGAWHRGLLEGAMAKITVPISFGAISLEVMAVDNQGVRTVKMRRLECVKQAAAKDVGESATSRVNQVAPEPLDVPGIGKIDPLGAESPVISEKPAPQGPTAEVPQPDPDAGQIASPENSAETIPISNDPEEDGNYGSEPPEVEPDPTAMDDSGAGPDEAEEDDELDPDQWLNDPEVDTAEDPAYAEPELPEDLDYQPPDMESWDDMDAPVEDPPPTAENGFPDAGGMLPPPSGDAGGYVGVQQRQADSYCTNRPDVGVKFQLPDWLKKLNLPKPGSKEFEAAFQKKLAELKAKGIDTSKLEALRKVLQNRCNRLNMPEELPDFLQSLGFQFGYKPKANPAELAEWREKMASATDAFLLRLLYSGNPTLISQGLQARMGSLGQFDTAAKESAEAALETLKANQQLTQDIATAIPYLNIAVSAHTLLTGESLTGEKLGKLDTVFHLLTLAGPAYQLLKNPALRQAAASVWNKAMWLGEKGITTLAGKIGVTPAQLKAGMQAMSKALGEARIKAGEKLLGKAWAEGQRFLNSPAGRDAAARAARDVKQAEALLHRIAQARAAGDKRLVQNLIGKLQGNKTAQGLLNSQKYSNAFRDTLNKTHTEIMKRVDKRAISNFMKTPGAQKEIEALAKKFNVRPEDIFVRARNVSGNTAKLSKLKPGEVLKYGADRDVVYQYCVKGKFGYPKSLKDVHHKAMGEIYNESLKKLTGRSAKSMDHVVTSRWNPEAYNAGLNPNTQAGRDAIGNIISGKAAGNLKRAADIRDTIIHKGKEWMDAGNKWAARGAREGKDIYTRIGNQKIKEGMRQMGKEYNRQVAQFLGAKGLDPAKALPPRLRQGLDIFKQVEKGMPVEQAQAMLNALTPKGGVPVTPQTIAEDLGMFVEYMNRWGLKAG